MTWDAPSIEANERRQRVIERCTDPPACFRVTDTYSDGRTKMRLVPDVLVYDPKPFDERGIAALKLNMGSDFVEEFDAEHEAICAAIRATWPTKPAA